MPAARHCRLLIPGDWRTLTGGYRYDRRLVESLRARGASVEWLRLDGAWPRPDEASLAEARRAIAALPDGECVVADGLAFGALGEVVAPHARRLRWLALVHHPLHLETGLDAAAAQALRERESAALRHARWVVAVSGQTARDVAELGVPPDRITVVEPGNDAVAAPGFTAAGAGAPGRAGPEGGGVQLLCVATLTPRKAHAVLLDALSGLLALDWTLHCVGSAARDPALAAALHARTAGGPLAQRVHWHGELSAEVLQARYASADLFVLASLHEGFGMVVNEALMHGLPIVASRAGALAHTVPAGAGLLVPPGDAGAWRAALATAIADRTLRERWADAAWQAARALPSWDQQAERFEAVLDRVRGLAW
ncbi:glycosyltransferase family 4 protein [Hydrogenophaga sp. YM1]|uniref:glycosyltransferase family 4 protein n=2 Tax=unclassified Hydrogenophaga TaxID=2610897 RepID=UPI001958A669|nr:glycosyltransferase family 4 protein [Hydrogenophaga sp. YM1]QRR32382.1 glycosyltransferase family 4 protein [Hydrogenophaga sp. YM1]